MRLGPQELILLLIIVLVLFGGRKIPEIMRGFGEGLREFKKATREATDELTKLADEQPQEPGDDHKPSA